MVRCSIEKEKTTLQSDEFFLICGPLITLVVKNPPASAGDIRETGWWVIVNFWRPASMPSPSRLSSPLQNFLNHHCAVCSLQFLGQMHCWWCELSSLLYNSFWTRIRKSIRFAFCLNIISVCVCSVVSDSLLPHGLWSTRLLCPWDFLGKSTGAGCHYLQGMDLSDPGILRLLQWQMDSLPLATPVKSLLLSFS